MIDGVLLSGVVYRRRAGVLISIPFVDHQGPALFARMIDS